MKKNIFFLRKRIELGSTYGCDNEEQNENKKLEEDTMLKNMLKKMLVCGIGLSMALFMSGCSSKESLLEAAKTGDVAKLEKCLADKIDINSLDAQGETPLLLAAENNQEQVVKVLVEKGANLNAASPENGNTALQIAVLKGEIPIQKILAQKGASLELKNSKGETAFTVKDKDGKTMINQVAATEDIALAQLLLDKMPAMNSADKHENQLLAAGDNQGNAPLHTALANNRKAMGKTLIDRGANIDRKNGKGEDAFAIASNQKMYDVLSCLYLKKGDLEKALANGELALKADESNLELLYNKGIILSMMGEKQQKEGNLEAAQKDTQQAKDTMKKVLDKDANFKDAKQKSDQWGENIKNMELALKKQEEARQRAEEEKAQRQATANQAAANKQATAQNGGYRNNNGMDDATRRMMQNYIINSMMENNRMINRALTGF